MRATITIFDALGASDVSEELVLDRHWRNARTLASHNPRGHKARILGDWLINGKDRVPDLATRGRRRHAHIGAFAGWNTPVLSASSSARMTWTTALISARWVNAWGKFPRWRPVRGSISSA